MYFNGLITGIVAFLIIGGLHPVVIKTEYYIGKKAWPVFGIAGIGCIVASLFCNQNIISPILAILGFSLLWSIQELFEQEERVKKGWFPKNPKKKLE